MWKNSNLYKIWGSPLFHRLIREQKGALLWALPLLPLDAFLQSQVNLILIKVKDLLVLDTPRVSLDAFLGSRYVQLLDGWVEGTVDRKWLILTLPTFLMGVAFLRLITAFLSTYSLERVGLRMATSLRVRLMSGFLNAPGLVLDRQNLDMLANQIVSDSAMLQEGISRGILILIRDGLLLIFSMFSLLFYFPQSFVLVLFAILPLFLILTRVSRRISWYSTEAIRLQNEQSSLGTETKDGFLSIAAQQAQRKYLKFLSKRSLNFRNFMFKSLMTRTFVRPFMEVVVGVLMVLAIIWKITKGSELDTNALTSICIMLALLFRSVKNIASLTTQNSELAATLSRLDAQESLFAQRNNEISSPMAPRAPLAVHTRDLRLSLPSPSGGEDVALWPPLNLNFNEGESIAIVGESGAGKSTLLRLLAGVLEPQGGTLERKSGGLLVTQFPYVFRGTVLDNLVYNQSEIRESVPQLEKAKDLLGRLGLSHSEFYAQLLMEKKLSFMGHGLSGGEKARLALARALIQEPSWLFLDEPTANLDAQSAQLYWEAVMAWKNQDKTRLLVAVTHNPSERRYANRVLRVKWGEHPSEEAP